MNERQYRPGDVSNGWVLTDHETEHGGWEQLPTTDTRHPDYQPIGAGTPLVPNTTTPTPRKSHLLRNVGFALAGLLALGAGFGLTAPDQAERTVTKTVTKEVEVDKPVTPQECTAAIDSGDKLLTLAEQGFDLTSQSFGSVEAGLNAALAFNQAGVDAALADIEAQSGEIDTLAAQVQAERAVYNEQSAACRATS